MIDFWFEMDSIVLYGIFIFLAFVTIIAVLIILFPPSVSYTYTREIPINPFNI